MTGTGVALSDYTKDHPACLGKMGAEFGGVSFLFKVLSVAKALSIQAHPNKVRVTFTMQSPKRCTFQGPGLQYGILIRIPYVQGWIHTGLLRREGQPIPNFSKKVSITNILVHVCIRMVNIFGPPPQIF